MATPFARPHLMSTVCAVQSSCSRGPPEASQAAMLEMVPASFACCEGPCSPVSPPTAPLGGRRLTASARAHAAVDGGDALAHWQWTASTYHVRQPGGHAYSMHSGPAGEVAVLEYEHNMWPSGTAESPIASNNTPRPDTLEKNMGRTAPVSQLQIGSGCGKGWPLERSDTKRSGAWPHGGLG